MGVMGPADLTAINAGVSWNADSSNTLGAWDFGTGRQIPVLKYADYDDDGGTTFNCNQVSPPMSPAAPPSCLVRRV